MQVEHSAPIIKHAPGRPRSQQRAVEEFAVEALIVTARDPPRATLFRSNYGA